MNESVCKHGADDATVVRPVSSPLTPVALGFPQLLLSVRRRGRRCWRRRKRRRKPLRTA